MDTETTQNETSVKIAKLNDEFRRNMEGCTVTRGIAAMGAAANEVFVGVRDFSAFTEDNDPYSEHDFATPLSLLARIIPDTQRVIRRGAYLSRNKRWNTKKCSSIRVNEFSLALNRDNSLLVIPRRISRYIIVTFRKVNFSAPLVAIALLWSSVFLPKEKAVAALPISACCTMSELILLHCATRIPIVAPAEAVANRSSVPCRKLPRKYTHPKMSVFSW